MRIFIGYYKLENNEVVKNNIIAESFLVGDETGKERELFLWDYTIYNEKHYVILSENSNCISEGLKEDEDIYIYRAKVHDGNCTLIDLSEDENADEIMNYYSESDDFDLMAAELKE